MQHNKLHFGVPTRGITARELVARSDRKIITDIVYEQIKLIDAAILTAHAAGFDHYEHELPTNFNINNLNKSDAQTLIYSELLSIYRAPEPVGKGYADVSINVGIKSSLHISWQNGMDDDERARRQEYIRACMVRHPSTKTQRIYKK